MTRLAAVFRTLRGRLVLLVCFATLPALLFTFYVASNERAAVLRRIESDARLLAQLASREHAYQFEGATRLLHDLVRVLAEPGAMDAPGGCPAYLPALLAGYPQFTTIGILSPDGALLCTAHPAPRPLSFAQNAAFRRALASSHVEAGDYTVGPVVGRPVLHLAYALRDASGAPRWVLFVGLDLQWLDTIVREAKVPPGYALLIADQGGRVLGRSAGATWPARDPAADAALAAVVKSSGAAVVDVPGAGRRFLVATPMRGIQGVSVVASLPYERVHGEANRAFYRIAAGLVLLTAFTIACALFAAELSVLRVLRMISRTARRFGEGDLTARANVPPGRGELTDLARAFNGMAQALAARQREAVEVQEQLRALSHRLVVAREAEAARIARELHDELGQVLTSVKVELATLELGSAAPGAARPDPGALRARVADLKRRIDDAVGFVRRLSADLRPPVLDRLGLAAALEAHAREVEARTRLAVVLDVEGVEEPVDALASITLFRIAREALTNVVRHAEATEVSIDLRGTDEAYVLTIHDDGKGIGPGDAEDVRALGVLGMKERCALAGGTLALSGAPGRGTTLVATIPRRRVDGSDAAHPAG